MSTLKRIARKILLDELAKPLIQPSPLVEVIDKSPTFHVMRFGMQNQDRTFYVIRRSPGSGFFSNLAYVLNHLKICDSLGFTPAIDFENFPTLYNEQSHVNATKNAWEYYFNPVSSYSLDEIYASNSVIVTDGKWHSSMPMSITQDRQLLHVYDKYIKPKQEILSDSIAFANQHFTNEKVLAIHFRGQELRRARGHPFPPTKRQVLSRARSLILDRQFTKIFISTESLDYLNFLEDSLSISVCSFPSYRSNKNSYLEKPRDMHRYLLGRDILVELLLMLKSDALLCGGSNVSETAAFLAQDKPNYYQRIWNGINSSNPLTAKYLWYVRAILPAQLGGFC